MIAAGTGRRPRIGLGTAIAVAGLVLIAIVGWCLHMLGRRLDLWAARRILEINRRVLAQAGELPARGDG